MLDSSFLGAAANIARDPAKIKDILKNILEQDQFAPPPPSFLDQILQYIANSPILGKILEKLAEIMRNEAVGVSFYVLLYIALAGILTFLVLSIRKKISISTKSADEWKKEETNSLDPKVWEKLAAQNAEKNDFESAIRNLYAALLLYLNLKGVLQLSRYLTNRENEKLVQKSCPKEYYDNFSRLGAIFEEKIYALKPCNENDYELFRQYYLHCKRGADLI